MDFNYSTLKRYAQLGERIGNWNGRAVFSASAADLDNLGSGAFYVLYDDENNIVARDGNRWYSYGSVTESGGVNEYDRRRPYNTVAPRTRYAAEPSVPVAEAEYTVGYEVEAAVVGDVVTGIDVDATLAKARTMSIEDLLDGFMADIMAKG